MFHGHPSNRLVSKISDGEDSFGFCSGVKVMSMSLYFLCTHALQSTVQSPVLVMVSGEMNGNLVSVHPQVWEAVSCITTLTCFEREGFLRGFSVSYPTHEIWFGVWPGATNC